MSNKLDLTGKRFGRLVVMEKYGRTKHKAVVWKCLCDCGKETNVVAKDLTVGNTTSCGCYNRERTGELLRTHGLSKHPLYTIWNTMMDRCLDKNSQHYAGYGGRGITVCVRWQSVKNFVEDMGPLYRQGLQIDRINNDEGYCPENCRWVTCKENQRNKRNNRLITYKGETKTLIEWAEILGVGRTTLRGRIKKGWAVDRAFETPIRKIGKR